ncbi:MAG: HigA protein (Antitoxin to HigB) [uncultured Sulfurovum sp.]|uniref:HigA protein (Antitoxin to HigB) n=1 Tax=uncultured Sulfurovum sp. TaxID=269237 RepID=A0A6S6RZ63_9BACT|nr:MAG: HigA protein (Antitoxin to HigB) [uncultured Sulfurovum sp.]
MVISANELKIKGVSLIENMLEKLDEVFISIRGQNKFVVVDIERYNYLRECELERALKETKEDIANGNSRVLSANEHFKELDDALRN